MPLLPIPAEVIARIVELRQSGLSTRKIAAALGVSPSSVGRHSAASTIKPRRGRPPGRVFYDDPRFIHPPEDEYADVEPIPFFPADLPRLAPDPFLWTPAELCSAVLHARNKLFDSPRTSNARRSKTTQVDQHRPTH